MKNDTMFSEKRSRSPIFRLLRGAGDLLETLAAPSDGRGKKRFSRTECLITRILKAPAASRFDALDVHCLQGRDRIVAARLSELEMRVPCPAAAIQLPCIGIYGSAVFQKIGH